MSGNGLMEKERLLLYVFKPTHIPISQASLTSLMSPNNPQVILKRSLIKAGILITKASIPRHRM